MTRNIQHWKLITHFAYKKIEVRHFHPDLEEFTRYLAQVTYNQAHVQSLRINYLASNHRGKIISARHKDVSV